LKCESYKYRLNYKISQNKTTISKGHRKTQESERNTYSIAEKKSTKAI
jgi:hypothetical protein